MALVDRDAAPANFAGISALAPGRSHLEELGVNALELLPIADSWVDREWGYAPSNYFAPDHSLGFPTGYSSPTANADLVDLVGRCHTRGIRFLIDVVMAFGTRAPMENVNFPVFHIIPSAEQGNPEAYQSSRDHELRDGFGGRLWRYAYFTKTYDPVEGVKKSIAPARQFMNAYLLRWMSDFGVDGIRIDSVNNIASWHFVKEFRDLARQEWKAAGGTDDRFIVIGEELAIPKELLKQERLDALWNEHFREMVRYAIEGKNWIDREQSFEWTVRKMIDCRLMGFDDGAKAINYVGSHDVGNFRGRRLYNQLVHDGIHQTEERIKLAFACLLTAVGIPMIFAGDEFADEHDLGIGNPDKQRDAVNFERLEQPWRRAIFDYVARLVKFRTSYPALGLNDTDFIHVDFNDNKRVVCWRRGFSNSAEQVVVVANFSDYGTPDPNNPSAEYRVPNWPATPPAKKWREITQQRDVPDEWVAREPIFPWEAKVYALVDE
jgi:1,4-alpha-glucan branching enzyme